MFKYVKKHNYIVLYLHVLRLSGRSKETGERGEPIVALLVMPMPKSGEKTFGRRFRGTRMSVNGFVLAGFLAAIVCSLPAFDVIASQRTYLFTHLKPTHGLPNPSVQAIVQDAAGHLWFGTAYGLARYNGYEMDVFRFEPGDPHSLSNNHITVLFTDSDLQMWVGTLGGGLHLYEPEHERFVRVQGDPENWLTLSDNSIWAVAEDHQGYLWVGTSYGLNKLNRHSLVVEERFIAESEHSGGLISNEIRALEFDSRGNLWVGTHQGLHRMDVESRFFSVYTHDASVPGSFPADRITDVLASEDGALLVASRGGGVHRFNAQGNTFELLDQRLPGAVSVLMQDSQGMVWIGGEQAGLYMYDASDQTVRAMEHHPFDPMSFGEGGVNALYESREGILWAGLNTSGISMLDRGKTRFEHFFAAPGRGLTNNRVRGFAQDHLGYVWLASDGGGLHRLDPEKGTFQHYNHDPENSQSPGSDALLAVMYHENELWMGSYGAGLSVLSLDRGTYRHYRHDPSDPGSPGSNDIFRIVADRAGVVWLATNAGGLNRMLPGSDTFERFRANADDPRSILNDDVRAMYEDREGTFWVGTYSGHLSRFDPECMCLTHYEINKELRYYNSVIQAIAEDSKGNFWLASRGAGLLLFDRQQGRLLQTFTTDEGLSGNNVHAIEVDAHGMLWLSTNNGITRFDPETYAMQSFDVKNGVQPSDFVPGSSLRDARGSLYFGGFSGFNRFDPNEVVWRASPPDVVLTGLQIDHRPVAISEQGPLWVHVHYTDTLRLESETAAVTVEYAALNFASDQSVRYSYRLTGFDSDWVDAGVNRSATYTNLRPGFYIFEVRAGNNQVGWSHEAARIAVIVPRPYWMSWWFYALLAAAFAVVLLTLHRLRVYAIMRRNALLEQMVEEKTSELSQSNVIKDNLLAIIGHDLGNIASGLMGYVELVKDSMADGNVQEAQMFVQPLEHTTHKFRNVLRDVMAWAATQTGKTEHKPENFALAEITAEICDDLQELAAAKEVCLVWDKNDLEHRACYADRYMYAIVLRNVLHNAIKFTGRGKTVVLSVEPDESEIVVSVKDEGVGMSTGQIERLLNAGKIFSTKGTEGEEGTGLGLLLVQHLLQRNSGSLHIESTPGSGSTVSFRLPAARG